MARRISFRFFPERRQNCSLHPVSFRLIPAGQFTDLTGAVTHMQHLTSWVDSNATRRELAPLHVHALVI